MTNAPPPAESLLTPAEVAILFRVDPKTVTRWARAGRITSIRTLGGHRRYREDEVRALLRGEAPAVTAPQAPTQAKAPAPAGGIPMSDSPWPAGTAVRCEGETLRVTDRGGVLFLARHLGRGFYPLSSDLDGIEAVSTP
jgi:excisionase family DNA binding protein